MKDIGKGFNRIAGIYDGLARLVFGTKLKHAKAYFLQDMLACQQLLILGGGSGELLDMLSEKGFTGQITYLEGSDKMIQLAQGRQLETLRIQWLQQDALQWEGIANTFDGICCCFFLDIFSEHERAHLLDRCQTVLRGPGKFLLVDFHNEAQYRWLIRLMYTFFRLVSGISGNRLPQWEHLISGHGFRLVKQKYTASGLLLSQLYELIG
ncbi:MAG: class I SAM-dependent methyltransferase [Bacteroidota bacterium]